MALPSSGALSLLDIANEFGGSTPHSLSEYYGAAAGIPTSGQISIGNFYGASAGTPVNVSFYESRYGSGIGTVNVYITDTVGQILSPSIYTASGDLGTPNWFSRTTSTFAVNQNFRVAWHYVSGSGGNAWQSDYAIDTIFVNGTEITIPNDTGTLNDWLTVNNTNTSSSTVAYADRVEPRNATGSSLGRWWKRSRATPSSNTGPTGPHIPTFYLFTESSSPNAFAGANFWLFTEIITI